MDLLDKMNDALDYIEKNLIEEIDVEEAARKACCSPFNFQRMFSFIADVSLADYIRRRRLSMAAMKLLGTDQRGAGLSFCSHIDKSTLTAAQYIDDLIEVTNYLRKRFGQEKIYLMAHSWGTYFGIQAVQKAPELYRAYIAVGQVTCQAESEKRAFQYMLDYFAKTEDKKMLSKLEKNPCPSIGYDKIRDRVMHRAGIGTRHDMKSVATGIFFASLKNREYTRAERINLWRGKVLLNKNSQLTMNDDIRDKVTALAVPTYFFSGFTIIR